jgi:Cd2+/Zn2+-exporting ATPase
MAALSGIPTDVFVVSKFRVAFELKMTETNDIAKTLNVIDACLREKFSKEEQIRKITVDASIDILAVEHNPYYLTASAIADALDSYGYEVSIDYDAGADGMWALPSMESAKDTVEHHKSSVRVTVILSGVFWIISMFSMIGGNWEYLKYVALLSVAVGLPPIAMKAFATLRRFHFDVNCMMLFAVLGALALQEFTEAAAVTFRKYMFDLCSHAFHCVT